MNEYIEKLSQQIIDLRGPRVSAMDDYGSIKRALDQANATTKDMNKLLQSFWEAAAADDSAAMDANLQRIYAVSKAAAVDFARLAAEVLRARE